MPAFIADVHTAGAIIFLAVSGTGTLLPRREGPRNQTMALKEALLALGIPGAVLAPLYTTLIEVSGANQ